MYWLKLVMICIIPPLGVFFTVGLRGAFWLNILLTLCFFVPGFIHAVYILTRSLPVQQT